MAQKQGGKGKSSSPSDLGYWKRTSAEGQRSKRIARHARRMGLSLQQLARATAHTCPRHRPHDPDAGKSFVVFSGKSPDQSGLPLHALFVDGVCVEISPWASDVEKATSETHSALPFQHARISPITGFKTFVRAREYGARG